MHGYYDTEAPRYDESRGGRARAVAAADAVTRLVGTEGLLLDVAGGTGIVTAELARQGLDACVVDVSTGMTSLARERLPGRVLVGSADRLPVADASVVVVSTLWLLHLLPVVTADAVVAEAARVLRPGGRWVSTVDKSQAHGHEGEPGDDARRVSVVARAAGLVPDGRTSFSGPSRWGSATEGDPVFPVVCYRRVSAPTPRGDAAG